MNQPLDLFLLSKSLRLVFFEHGKRQFSRLQDRLVELLADLPHDHGLALEGKVRADDLEDEFTDIYALESARLSWLL